MSSHYTTVNNNYIIVNNIFNDCIINLCGFRFFWDTLYSGINTRVCNIISRATVQAHCDILFTYVQVNKKIIKML